MNIFKKGNEWHWDGKETTRKATFGMFKVMFYLYRISLI